MKTLKQLEKHGQFFLLALGIIFLNVICANAKNNEGYTPNADKYLKISQGSNYFNDKNEPYMIFDTYMYDLTDEDDALKYLKLKVSESPDGYYTSVAEWSTKGQGKPSNPYHYTDKDYTRVLNVTTLDPSYGTFAQDGDAVAVPGVHNNPKDLWASNIKVRWTIAPKYQGKKLYFKFDFYWLYSSYSSNTDGKTDSNVAYAPAGATFTGLDKSTTPNSVTTGRILDFAVSNKDSVTTRTISWSNITSPYISDLSRFEITTNYKTYYNIHSALRTYNISDSDLPYDKKQTIQIKSLSTFYSKLNSTQSYELKGYICPTALTLSPNKCDKSITLGWSTKNNVDGDKNVIYAVYRKKTGDTKYTYVKSTENATTLSIKDDSPALEFGKLYSYVVRCIPTAWNVSPSDSRFLVANAESIIPSTLSSGTTTIVIDTPTFSLFSAKANPTPSAPSIYLTWAEEWCKTSKVDLIRKIGATTDTIRISDGLITSPPVFYEDKGVKNGIPAVTINNEYTYQLKVTQTGNNVVYSKVINTDLIKKMVFDDSKFKATKGTLSDRIAVTWTIDDALLCNEFVVERREYNATNIADNEKGWREVRVLTCTKRTEIFDDMTILNGVAYQYRITGKFFVTNAGIITKTLSAQTILTDNSIGFCQPVGNISGRISFKTGSSVKDVEVIVDQLTNDSTSLMYRSLVFDGTSNQYGKVDFPKATHPCVANGLTFQCWANPITRDETSYQPIMELKDEFSVWLDKQMVNGKTVSGISLYLDPISKSVPVAFARIDSISNTDFFHITATYDKDSSLVKLFLDGKLKDRKLISTTDKDKLICKNSSTETAPLYIGTSFDANEKDRFKGKIDEVRMYNRPLQAKEVLSTFGRYISGEEKGLVGYWKMDEGITQFAFDYSSVNKVYNENHMSLMGASSVVDDLAKRKKLSIKGVTNEDGNYIISGIPFVGDGMPFTVTPMYDAHSFEPTQRLRFIGNGATVHNGTDFTDISSFKIGGTINYANTNVPVENVEIYIDGEAQVREGKVISTDIDGKYTVDVPIGYHYLEFKKYGHTFNDGGRWTKPDGGKILFDESSYKLLEVHNVIDSTLTVLSGRVVGGKIQSKEQLGAKRSVANIGQAEITLQLKTTSSALSLNNTAGILNQVSSYNAISSTSSIAKESQEIKIVTDPITGEYYAKLPPLNYEVKSITTTNGRYNKSDFSDVPDVVNLDAIVPIKETWNDTTWINKALNKIDKVTPNNISFNVRFDAIYQAPTTLELYPLKFKQDQTVYVAEAFGDSLMTFRPNPDIAKYDTIAAYSKSNDSIIYKVQAFNGMRLPVYKSDHAYGIRVKAYESYEPPTSKLNDSGFIRDYCTIPKSGTSFSVENGLAASQVNIQTQETTPNQSDGIKLGNDGTYDLWFITGFPDSKGRPMKFIVTLEDNTSNVGKDFDQAYMTGILPTDGSDFFTSIPVPLTVLRDPPGSNSYAYYEAGSELENASSISTNIHFGTEYQTERELGVKVSTLLGMTVTTEVEGKNKGTNNLKTAFEWNSNTKLAKKVALTEKISTSSSPDMVGRDADVFIGTGTNIYQTPSNDLSLIYDNNIYKIKNSVSQSTCLESATTFYYPRIHIVNTLLPQLRKELEGLLKTVAAGVYNDSYPKLADEYQYITTRESNASDLGVKGTYIEIPPINLPAKHSNKVMERLNDINMWKKWLSDDEQFTLEAKTGTKAGYKTENISFASGATIKKTYETTATKEHNSEFNANLEFSSKNEIGATLNKTGLNVSFNKTIGGGAGYSINVNSANHITYGYVLQDDNLSDYMAMDVCMPTNTTLKKEVSTNLDQQVKIDIQLVNGSPLFFLKGGISQCPHEGSTKTEFYNPGTKINDGTLAIDVPNLYIDAKNSQFINVPAGKPANVIIEMSNNTLTNVQSMFTLTYDVQKSKGALVTMDGVSIMDGKSFLLSKDQVLKKTIQIHQTQADVLNYDSIYLTLSPACDLGGASASTQRVRVSFMPTCSDLTLAIDDRLNNTRTSDTLTYKIKDFDIRYDELQEIQFQSSVNGGLTWSVERKYTGFSSLNSSLLRNDVSVPGLFVNGILSDKLRLIVEDGDYYFRARSKCKKGNDEYFVESEPIKVVKDQYRPRVMAFSPNNGILTPENEFSVLFNEDLNTGVIKPAIYKLTAILNDSITKGGVSLKTNGSGATTDSPIYINNSSFTIQAWYKYPVAGNGNLFKLGDGENQVSLSYRSQDKKLIVKTGLTDVSEIAITNPTTWEFLSLSYDADKDELSLSRVGSSTENKELLRKSVSNVSPQGRLTLGGTLQAEVYNVSIWSKAMVHSDVYSNKDLSFSGKEINMLAYWPMGEGKGIATVDRVSARSLLLNESVWGFTFDNRALSVDATNKFAVPFGETVFTNEQDFSVEFWMKGAKQVNTTLLSLGDGMSDFDVDGKFSLSFDETGQLQLWNSKQKTSLTTGTITDDAWHHLALTVTRGGVSKLYVDGALKSQFNSSNFGQIYGSNLRLGGRRYNKVSENDVKEDRNWTGKFDEFRVWKTALTPEFVRDMCNTKVKGNETGLLLYYPFENYTYGLNTAFENTIDNMVIGSKQKGISTGITNISNEEAPGMRDASLVSDLIRATGIVSSNKIVFDLSGYGMNRIEGTTIHLWIDNKGIEDKNGNLMANPVEKSIYLDMNRLNWESQLPISIKKEIMATASFKAILVNASSKIENYVVNGIPEWLECSNYTGQLNPLERKELTFTVNSAVNIGSYEALLSLIGNNNIEERLPVTLNVTGQRPNWSVNPALYTGSMSVTGKLLINGLIQEDENDLIAAFRGTTCVGVASPKYLKSTNNYLVFLDVYGEATNNNTALTFNIWDASTGRVYPNVNVLGGAFTYQDGGIVSTFNSPKQFDATNKIEQTMSLNTGWNWVSTYVKTTPVDIFNQFKKSIGTACIEIKNFDFYHNYYIEYDYWTGTLDSIVATSSYMIQASKPANVLLVGEMINPSTELMSISKNWNWLGYTPNFVMPTTTALLGLNAEVNDLIKGQSGYAIYTGPTTGWLGSLTFLQPGQGYMYYSNSSSKKQFSYPAKYVGQKNVRALSKNNTNLYYSFDKSLYQMNMSVNIEATMDGNPINSDKFEVAAFNGSECRGSIALKSEPIVSKYIGYLMLYGDQTANLTFKGYDANNSKTYVSEDNISYVPNGRLGTLFAPVKVRFTSSTTTDQSDLINGNKVIYPNPVINTLNFSYNPQGIERLEVVDCTGRTMVLSTAVVKNSIDISDLMPGIYTLRVNYKGAINSHRFIKK